MTTLTIGSLFAGIGGLELGLEWAGLGPTLWQVEIDPWCRGVLAKHWPNAKRYRDVRTIDTTTLEQVDVICGGFPCQDISVAGKQAGLSGARSGLWREFARIVTARRPRFVVVENVAQLASSGLDIVVADLDAAGYRVDGRIIEAADVGAPHRRARLFLVAQLANAGDDRRKERSEGDYHDRRDASRDEFNRRDPQMAHAGCCGRQPESGLGRGAHGLPARVERWPSRPGDAPAVWEPARATRAMTPTKTARLKSLGNAVVPRVSEAVGRLLLARWGGYALRAAGT